MKCTVDAVVKLGDTYHKPGTVLELKDGQVEKFKAKGHKVDKVDGRTKAENAG